MIGYQLTPEEKDLIQGQFFATDIFFYCVQDINDIWFVILSEQDKPLIEESQYAWVLNCPQAEYVPKPAPPFPGV